MKLLSYLLICSLLILAISTAGCTETTDEKASKQNTPNLFVEPNTISKQIFEKIEYNISSDIRFRWLNSNYETVTPNIDLFMESISNDRINLNLAGEVIELELKEVPVPKGASMVSLNNRVNLEISDSNDSIFQGRVIGVNNSSVWLLVSKKMGYIIGEINAGNKVYQIWNIDRQMNGKSVEIIHLSEDQNGELKFTAVPERTELKRGEIVNITLTLRNVGNNTLNVWNLENQISYDISLISLTDNKTAEYKCGADTRPPLTDEFLVELKPGESINSTGRSECWILSPGEYMLSAVYHAGSGEMISKPYWRGSVKSNEVLIKVRDTQNNLTEPPQIKK